MDLGEGFEETGLIIENLKLLNVHAGSKYYLKIPNGDELYSATAVYYTKDVSGDMKVDYNESKDMKYFTTDNLPNELTDNDREFIEEYINQ